MKDDNKIHFLRELDKYFQRNIVDTEAAVTVWFKFLEPLPDEVGQKLLEQIFFTHHFLPSPLQAQELLPDILGLDFDSEVNRVMDVYARRDRGEILALPETIMEAIELSGGLRKFRLVSEKEHPKLMQAYARNRMKNMQECITALPSTTPMAIAGGGHG